MKQFIRQNTFETNSSTTHSLTILSAEEFEQFEKGNVLIDWNNNLLTFDEAFEKMFNDDYSYEEAKEDYVNEMGYDSLEECMYEEELDEEKLKIEVFEFVNSNNGYDFHTYETMLGDKQEDYETFITEYTTKSGDKIVAFGYYGNNY